MDDITDISRVSENVKRVLYELRDAEVKFGRAENSVALMAVTKTVPPPLINAAAAAGAQLLGENRVQEFLEKKDLYEGGVPVHFIGSLQTNKVKYIINDADMIQSADSVKLCAEIDRLAAKNGKVMDILAEVNIGGEETKGGVSPEGLEGFLEEISRLANIRIRGLMTIPPPGASEMYFGKMQGIFEEIRSRYRTADVLSMGMSADYITAVKYGSTMVRVGTGLFGARKYKI